MPKNMFEEVAIEQQKEELTRIRIYAKLKANDIKGAHKLAKPYLERLNELNTKQIPTGWIRIAQIFCALDIDRYGVVPSNNKTHKEESWISSALEIVTCRLKGLVKSLIPVSMAIALITQVLSPLQLKAESPSAFGVKPDQIALKIKDISRFGKLEVTSKSKLDEENEITSPEIEWLLEDRGEGRPINKESIKLNASALTLKEGEIINLNWSVGTIKVKEGETGKALDLDIVAENISNEPVGITHFSTTELNYTGCSIKISDDITEEYSEYRSPLEIPAGKKAVYHISIEEGNTPTIIVKTKDGTIHSMLIDPPDFEKVKKDSKEIAWATYTGVNKSYKHLLLGTKPIEGSEISSISVESKPEQSTLVSPKTPLFLKPNQRVKLTVTCDIGKKPEIEVISKSDEGAREYILSSSKPLTVKEKISQKYELLSFLIFGDSKAPLNWNEIKTAYDKQVSMLIEDKGDRIMSGQLMSSLVKDHINAGMLQEKIEDSLSRELESGENPSKITNKEENQKEQSKRITGTLKVISPNLDEESIGTYFALECDKAIEYKSKEGETTSSRLIQLAPTDKSQVDSLKKLIGKRLSISGMPFTAHTSHHFTKVLMTVNKIKTDISPKKELSEPPSIN